MKSETVLYLEEDAAFRLVGGPVGVLQQVRDAIDVEEVARPLAALREDWDAPISPGAGRRG